MSCAILGIALVAFYFYLTRNFKYWQKRGLKYEEPVLVFGNMADAFFAKKSKSQLFEELYWKYPEEKVVGFFRASSPELFVRDPEIIKRIWATDFHSFFARGIQETDRDYEGIEMLRKNIVNVEGDIWRLLRQSTTPAFTRGKLKAMFPLVVERAEQLQQRARILSAGAQPVDARNLMMRYTIDIIGVCGFGIEGAALQNEGSDFHKLGEKISHIYTTEKLTIVLRTLFPNIFKHKKIMGTLEKDICDLVREVMRQRNYKPSRRHDFIDLILEVKQKGKMECESMEKVRPDGTPERFYMELSDELIAGQVFLFFSAGFETSSMASSFTLHEIAYNPEVQKKIQDEIDVVLAKYNNELCYDAIKEMHYLEWTFKEGMRVLPPISLLARTCRRKWTLQDMGLTIEEDTRVLISVQALHNDPKYWDRPEEFRPERFSPEINEPKHKYAYLPFGSGPRACIGDQMGTMTSMAGLATILSRFSVAPAPNSRRMPELNPSSIVVQGIIGGLPLIFTPRT